ncbi:MAG: PAS domain S-box protein [Methanomicrobiales archaeon]
MTQKPFWEARWWTFSPEIQAQLKDAVIRAAAGDFVRYEVDVQGAGCRVITIDFSLKPVMDASGTITSLVAEGRDITERKRVEKTLVESESFNRELVENLPEYVIVYEPDGKILYVNTATERALGYRSEDLVGTSVLSYVVGEHRENVISGMKARHEGREISPYEIDILSQEGYRRSVIVQGTRILNREF